MAPRVFDFQEHRYPYSTLPPLTSHICPHFVIYNLGEKLSRLTVGAFVSLAQQHRMLPTIVAIFELWTNTDLATLFGASPGMSPDDLEKRGFRRSRRGSDGDFSEPSQPPPDSFRDRKL